MAIESRMKKSVWDKLTPEEQEKEERQCEQAQTCLVLTDDAGNPIKESTEAGVIERQLIYGIRESIVLPKRIVESEHFTSGKVTQTKDAEGNVIKIGDEVVALEQNNYCMGQAKEDCITRGSINTIEEVHDDGDRVFFQEHAGRYGPWDARDFLKLNAYVKQHGQPVEEEPDEIEDDEDEDENEEDVQTNESLEHHLIKGIQEVISD
jgi:hypothetical protein